MSGVIFRTNLPFCSVWASIIPPDEYSHFCLFLVPFSLSLPFLLPVYALDLTTVLILNHSLKTNTDAFDEENMTWLRSACSVQPLCPFLAQNFSEDPDFALFHRADKPLSGQGKPKAPREKDIGAGGLGNNITELSSLCGHG